MRSADPRTIVTPDAFSVDPPLLGTPLASPRRRLGGIVLDFLFVFAITISTSNVWFALPFVIGFFLMSRAFERREKKARFDGARRFFLGCTGFMILSIAALIGWSIRWVDQNRDIVGGTIEELASGEFSSGDFAPDDLLDEMEARLETVEDETASGPADPSLVPLAELTLDEAIEEYVAWRALAPEERDEDRGKALAERIGLETAADTIADLVDEVGDLQRDVRSAEARAERAARGFGPWLRSKLDDLGFGLGWWTVYFAVFMPMLGGQTPGKKLMGIRVVRLDGQPINWWAAFERAGGYVAGFATATLGFLQVYWDPNRQMIHDKIAGTVVVRAGAKPVPGHWEHVVASEQVRIDRASGLEVPDAPPPPQDPDPTPE